MTARVQVAVANAEPVFPYQKEAVQQAFGCALRETYGMVELLAAAGECESGALHLFPEMGWLEVLDENGPVENGRDGEFVCTSLLDADMPLIRYRLGDRGALASETARCPCGRTLPILAALEGRSDDLLYTRDGRRIGRLDPIFKTSLAIREAQIVQESLERVRVRYVPSAGFSAADAATTAERLRQRMGSIDVVLEETAFLPRGPNGKLHAVVCQLSPQERQLLAERALPSSAVDAQAELR
jgi:phenylacetate-CoA ligase